MMAMWLVPFSPTSIKLLRFFIKKKNSISFPAKNPNLMYSDVMAVLVSCAIDRRLSATREYQ